MAAAPLLQSCAKCTRARRSERQGSRIGKDLNYSFGWVMGRTCHLWHLWSLRAAIHPRAERGEGPWLSWSSLVLTASLQGVWGEGEVVLSLRRWGLCPDFVQELNKDRETRWDGERGGGAAGQNTGSGVAGSEVIGTL